MNTNKFGVQRGFFVGACSSIGQSNRFLNDWLQVRFLPSAQEEDINNMKDFDIQQISEIEAAGKASELWHCVKTIDDRPFASQEVKKSLTQAAAAGQICLVALECVAAYPDASSQGIGKTPVDSPDLMQQYSTAFYNSEAIKHFINKCHGLGISVDYHVFLEDDDFVHSVDPAWGIQNANISQAIGFQKSYFVEEYPSACGLQTPDSLHIHHCKETEYKSTEIKAARGVIYKYIKNGINGTTKLPGPVVGRLENFVNWRKEIAKSAGVVPNEEHLLDLAVEELTGFAYQGHFAPLLAKEISGENVPIMYVNTYPGHYFADDLCVRLGIQWVGLQGLPLGTIHPNIDFCNKKTAPKDGPCVKSKGKIFTCGDPKGNPNY